MFALAALALLLPNQDPTSTSLRVPIQPAEPALNATSVSIGPDARPAADAFFPSPTYLWQDFDRDGRSDVYVRSPARADRLLLNLGASFEDVTERYGLSGLDATLAVTWTDFETDGLPDLHVVTADGASHLFHNTGSGFIDVTESAGVVHDDPAVFHEWIDADGDRLPDLHVVTPGSDILFRNQGGGRFATVPLPTGGVPGAMFPTNGAVVEKGLPKVPAGEGGATASLRKDAGRPAARSAASATRRDSGSSGSQDLGTCGTTTIDDQGAAGCLQASTTPTLGLLYPLSTNLNVDGTGQVGIGTTSPTQKLDVDGTIRSRSGGFEFPDGSTQTSSQALDGSFAYGAGNDPTGTLQFLAPPATVTIGTGQKVSVTSNKGLGSRYTQGACCLSLWVGYRLLPSGPISVLGGGIVGNKVNRNTRTVMGVNGIITGLAPGTYEVGMVGGTGDLHWDFNGSGYTSALVFD